MLNQAPKSMPGHPAPKHCHMCGSPAKIGDSGSVSECYGRQWQDVYIECTDAKNDHCGMRISIYADFFNIRNAELVLIEAWNKLGPN